MIRKENSCSKLIFDEFLMTLEAFLKGKVTFYNLANFTSLLSLSVKYHRNVCFLSENDHF